MQMSLPFAMTRRIAGYGFAVLLLFLLAGCDQGRYVGGEVVGTSNKPVSGAEVQFGGVEAITKPDGKFSIGFIGEAGSDTLTVSKPGYVTYHEEIHKRHAENLVIILVKEGVEKRNGK